MLRKYRFGVFEPEFFRQRIVQNVAAPVCMTCGRPVAIEELVDGEEGVTTYAKVLAKCHGEEELEIFDFGTKEWDWTTLKTARMRRNWFDPMRLGGLGRARPSDMDKLEERADGERIFSVPANDVAANDNESKPPAKLAGE